MTGVRSLRWRETKTFDEAKALYERMWDVVQQPDYNGGIRFTVTGEGLYRDGEFWSEAIRKLRSEPDKRLQMAEEHLPLPAAFSEAAIALRAIIRDRRSSSHDFTGPLTKLHRLAAIDSFAMAYAPRLKQPGYNVIARVPFIEFEAMALSWNVIGCNQLKLLTASDRKLMVASWGPPQAHTTANELYRLVWDRYESMLVIERDHRSDS